MGASRRLRPIEDLDAFRATRDTWHRLAEHVLAPARYATSGRIGLRATRGGIGTPPFGEGEEVRIQRGSGPRPVLVDVRAGRVREGAVTTLRDAAARLGREPGAPADVYEPATPLDPDARLTVDPASEQVLAGWFDFATSVLEQLRVEAAPEDDASLVQLWPEHFDLAGELGNAAAGARGTFGASPGDDEHPEPYVYVTHWSDAPEDAYWNDPAFGGASRSWAELTRADDPHDAALRFFRQGREMLREAGT